MICKLKLNYSTNLKISNKKKIVMTQLAQLLRPKNIDEFIGQDHLMAKNQPLRVMIEKDEPSSLILWGPPGSGKTTIARMMTGKSREFFELSAVSAGKADVKAIVDNILPLQNAPIVFLDEIHRFNKSQQDYLLPYVEVGKIILIGATTENPSFEVIPALLSRTKVYVLQSLSIQELKIILSRAINILKKNFPTLRIDKKSIDWLLDYSWGDARKMLNTLELCAQLYETINLKNLQAVAQHNPLGHDKKSDAHYDTISALIKSMRAGDPNASLYYLARLIEGGEDPLFIARRLVIFASEDVGMAQPTALVVANAVFQACQTIGLPECSINLAHGVVYLANAQKNRCAYDGLQNAMTEVSKSGNLPIPLDLRNAPTSLMKKLGYGKNYTLYPSKNLSLLPDAIIGKEFFKLQKK